MEGTVTTDSVYDRADQLQQQTIAGVSRSFDYDRYGNLTSSWDGTSAQTTYGYDEASRLTAINPPGGAPAAIGFTLDALDRPVTRTTGGSTSDTYGYLDATETAYLTGSGTTTGSLLDAEGTRLAVKTGAQVSWLVFDLHGSVAAICPAGSTTLSDAYRYDGWGVQVASAGSVTNPYRYRGLLNLANDTGAGALLAMGAREYSPQLGTFTQQDSYAGSAANPASLNRFLYALANPATLIDPDGHMADACGGGTCQGQAAPTPTDGLRTGGDCGQACVDQLNASGVNTYGDSGGPIPPTSGTGYVPSKYGPDSPPPPTTAPYNACSPSNPMGKVIGGLILIPSGILVFGIGVVIVGLGVGEIGAAGVETVVTGGFGAPVAVLQTAGGVNLIFYGGTTVLVGVGTTAAGVSLVGSAFTC